MPIAQGHIVTPQMNQQPSSFLETTCCSTPKVLQVCSPEVRVFGRSPTHIILTRGGWGLSGGRPGDPGPPAWPC